MRLKPEDLNARLNACFTESGSQAILIFDELILESLLLIEQLMPSINVASFRQQYHTRRQPFTDSPLLKSK
jgi:hypothetical protein